MIFRTGCNDMNFKNAAIVAVKTVFLALATFASAGSIAADLINGLGGNIGFGQLAMSANDDGSSGLIDLTTAFPSGVNLFGNTYTALYINNNGNVSFSSGIAQFTPDPFPVTNRPMIAPYWGDVDTRGGVPSGEPSGSNQVYYGTSASGEFVVTWFNVGYYQWGTNKLNSFQLVLRDRSSTGLGNFDVEFRYARLEWTTGSASGGAGGLGGIPAQVGFDAGDGENFYAHADSRTAGVLNLVNTSNVGEEGVWRFQIRNGGITEPPLDTLHDVHISVYVPAAGVTVDTSSFTVPPQSEALDGDLRVLSWFFETITADQVEDLSFDVVMHDPQPQEARAIVSRMTLDYIDANGNPVHSELGEQTVSVSASQYSSSLTASSSTYGPNAEASFLATVQNIGAISSSAGALVEIYDSIGELVSSLPSQPVGPLVSGEVATLAFPWNTGSTLSGKYTARLLVEDADSVQSSTSEAAFSIMSSGGSEGSTVLALRSSSDRASYHTSDTVFVESLITNESINTIASDLLLAVSVYDPLGQIAFNDMQSLLDLSAGGQQLRSSSFVLIDAAQGTYTLMAQVLDASGEEILFSDSNFLVAENSVLALRGEAKPLAKNLYVGQDQTCQFALANEGTVSYVGLSPERLLVDVGAQQVLSSTAWDVDLAPNANAQVSDVFATDSLEPGAYACLLRSILDGQEVIMAAGQFSVLAKPVNFTSRVRSPADPHILVLVDGLVGADPGSEGSHPLLEEQATFVQDMLNQLGVSYLVVDSHQHFATELHTGKHNQYLVLAETLSLAGAARTELQQAIMSGDGLMTNAPAIVSSAALGAISGVKVADLRPSGELLQLTSSKYGATGIQYPLALAETLHAFHADGAVVHAGLTSSNLMWQFEDRQSCRISDSAPILAESTYGRGTVVSAGFDWPAQGVRSLEWAGLMEAAVHHSYPSKAALPLESDVPIEIDLSSSTGGTGRILFTAPAGSQAAFPAGWETLADGRWLRPFTLPEGGQIVETVKLSFAQEGEYPIEIAIEYAHADAFERYETVSKTISVAPTPTVDDVLVQVEGLITGHPRDPWLKLAKSALEAAKASIAGGDQVAAVRSLEEASEWLNKGGSLAADVRQKLAETYLKLIRLGL